MPTMSSRTRTLLRLTLAAAGGILAGAGCSSPDRPTGPAQPTASASVSGASQAVYSGQRQLGQASIEPAVNDWNGATVYLLTPNHVPGVPFPSVSNPVASAPIYLPVYPANSTIDPSVLNCQPTNCDHVNVLPFPAQGYPNGGQTCVQYGFPAGACALLIGHDHLIGVPHTGDFNVAWHVILVVFTPKGLTDGASNQRVLTLAGIKALEENGEAFEAPTPITFNCSIVNPQTYLLGTPFTM